jgi:hypothetical protein
MNDYDGRIKDSYGHEPTSMALQLMAEPEGNVASRLVSAGEHVKSADRFTDWYACNCFISRAGDFDTSCVRYDIDNDCVDDGGREHSAIGMRLT